MFCVEIESEMPDFLDNHLPPDRRQEVENHLAGCPGCRTFVRRFQQLDAVLSSRLKVPELSANFDHKLLERIHSAPAVLTEAQRTERKRQLQDEYEAGMARITRTPLTLVQSVKSPDQGWVGRRRKLVRLARYLAMDRFAWFPDRTARPCPHHPSLGGRRRNIPGHRFGRSVLATVEIFESIIEFFSLTPFQTPPGVAI